MRAWFAVVLALVLAVGVGCYYEYPFVPPPDPVAPVPPVPPDPPDPPPVPTNDPAVPPADFTTYGEAEWSQIVPGMTEEQVFAIMPKWWLRDVGPVRVSYTYVTDKKHENGYPYLFIVRFTKNAAGALTVLETSGRPF